MGKFLGLARVVALGAALALAGCVTAENSLSRNDIASMKLTAVNVSFAPNAHVLFEDGIRAYAISKAITDDQIATAANTPEGHAYVNNLLEPRIKAEVERAMAGQLVGVRPVRLEVVVKSFEMPSAAQRILIGGHRAMTADVNLVDARTGAVLLAYNDQRTLMYTGQGVLGAAIQAGVDNSGEKGVPEKIAADYAQSYRNWLLRQS